MTTSDQSESGTYYYYIRSSRDCEAVPASCVQPYSNCSFTSLEECQTTCRHIGGCESTPYGCCTEGGVARAADGTCPGENVGMKLPLCARLTCIVCWLILSPDEEEAAGGQSSNSSGVRWDLLATGICGTVLLLGAVAVIGIVTYVYKHKARQRHRRRYVTFCY